MKERRYRYEVRWREQDRIYFRFYKNRPSAIRLAEELQDQGHEVIVVDRFPPVNRI